MKDIFFLEKLHDFKIIIKMLQELTCAISFRVQQKLTNVTLTKSPPKQTVTVFSSNVSCEPIVTI